MGVNGKRYRPHRNKQKQNTMPIYLTLASLIIDKDTIEKKYKGGIKQFRNDYFKKQGDASQ